MCNYVIVSLKACGLMGFCRRFSGCAEEKRRSVDHACIRYKCHQCARESCGVCLPSEQVLVRARGFWGCVFQGKRGLSSFSFPKSGGWLWSWAELRGTKVWVRTEGFLMEGKWGISDLCESQMEPLTEGKSCLESRMCSMAR